MTLPVLAIPGLNCSGRLYADILPALWTSGPVTVADHRNGESMAEIAAAILKDAPRVFALAGFSMGGYIAFEILRQARERVRKLALLDTSARPESPEAAEKRKGAIELAKGGRFGTLVNTQYPLLVSPAHARDAALRAAYVAMAEDVGPEAFVRHSWAIMARPDSRPDLGRIKVPTVVMVGEADQITPPELSREMAEAIPGARLVTIPNAGHLAPLENAEAVSKALGGWLD